MHADERDDQLEIVQKCASARHQSFLTTLLLEMMLCPCLLYRLHHVSERVDMQGEGFSKTSLEHLNCGLWSWIHCKPVHEQSSGEQPYTVSCFIPLLTRSRQARYTMLWLIALLHCYVQCHAGMHQSRACSCSVLLLDRQHPNKPRHSLSFDSHTP